MDTLQQIIENKLAQKRSHVELEKDFPRAQIQFPEIHTVDNTIETPSQKKAKKLVGRYQQKLKAEKLAQVSRFFVENPYISLKNHSRASKIFFGLFTDKSEYAENIQCLVEEFDKKTDRVQRFGKVSISSSKSGRICLERSSYELGYLKQYISLDFDSKELVAYTIWSDKSKGIELVRPRKFEDKKAPAYSLEFDVNIWREFNHFGISPKDYMKSLDCIERNHLELDKFINKVNRRSLVNLVSKPIMDEATITTNAKNTSFVDFTNSLEQKVKVKITKSASSLAISL